MDIFFLFFFYTIPASLFFIYGIGVEQLIANTRLKSFCFSIIGKNMIHMVSAASLIWLMQAYIVLPVRFSFILPIFAGCIVFFSEIIIQFFFTKTLEPKLYERVFSYGTVFFTFFFACSYAELLIIIVSACFGLMIWSFILSGVMVRMNETKVTEQWKNAPLIFVTMGIISLALYAWNNVEFIFFQL